MTSKTGTSEPVDTIHLASDIVAAYVSNNAVKSEQLPDLLQQVYAAVSGLAAGDPVYGGNREPAVPINKWPSRYNPFRPTTPISQPATGFETTGGLAASRTPPTGRESTSGWRATALATISSRILS